jgi:uncharacterized membrane protein YeaQ/YmgE (transglycosylase-associated protein family)
MPIIVLIIIGAAAGFLATRLMRLDTDIPAPLAIGIAGALIGGLVLRGLSNLMGLMAGFVGAVLGAVLLIWLWQHFFRR